MPKRERRRKIYKKKRKVLKVLKILFQVFGAGLFCLFLLGAGVFIVFIKDLPRPEKFTEGVIAQSTKIYDREGKVLLYEIAGEEKRTIVPLKDVPDYLKWAVITTEDRKFYEHRGLDLKAIARAILYDLKIRKPVQGASTISQQLIRSYFLTRKKTLERKTREIILTLELERRYSKEQILEWYFNLIPFGSNLYGVESACQSFFRKSVSEISLAEAATLTALIRAPSLLWPYGPNLEELLLRKNYILEEMRKAHYITQAQAEEAKKEEVKFFQNLNPIKAPHFVMYVKEYLKNKYGENFLTRAGLRIITTLDIDLQEKAENLLKEGLEKVKEYNVNNGGLVAVNPKTGEVLVMVGSKDYFGTSSPEKCVTGETCLFDPEVNVTLSLRQPGSAFKPFAYAAAFIKGFTPNTLIWDVPTEFNLYCPPEANQKRDKYGLECYHPRNYDGKFKGLINIRSCLAQSRNLPSVKVLYLTGIKETLALAEDCGIQTLQDEKRYGLALVLGGGEVKLLEMVSAFGVFANDGIKAPLNVIKQIEDAKGNIIEETKKSPIKVLPSQTARQINDILSDNEARAPLFGWNSALYFKEKDVAAKTGTTQDYRDGWTIGYTPSLSCGVWVGNNNNDPMAKKPGVLLSSPIWRAFLEEALKKFPEEEFKEPEEIITGKPVLDGTAPEEPHSILYFIDKKNPQGQPPENPEKDSQYNNWEYGVQKFLGFPKTINTEKTKATTTEETR